jgi:hypothetical protein
MLLQSHQLIVFSSDFLRKSFKAMPQMILAFGLVYKQMIYILIPFCFTVRGIDFLIIFKVKPFSNRIERFLSLILLRITLSSADHFSKFKQKSNHYFQVDNLACDHANHNHKLTSFFLLRRLHFGNEEL